MTDDPLLDFWAARIAEDEAMAKAATTGDFGWESGGNVVWVKNDPRGDSLDGLIGGRGEWPSWVDGHDITPHIARHDPARVLADCEAKRRIVEHWKSTVEWAEDPGCDSPDRYHMVAAGLYEAMRHLAEPFADHPDYREEWKP
jgi:hypothetical protein